MPIAPENRKRYPPDWRAISQRIRFERAGGRCECRGECGHSHEGARCRCCGVRGHEDRRCSRAHGDPLDHDAERGGNRRVILTVAHLDHAPENCADENLKAMCQACHLAYDAAHHAQSRRARRHRDQRDMFNADAPSSVP